MLERKRRLTIANKLMESISDSVESLPSSPSPFGSLTDTLSAFDEELEKHPVRIRSRSAEGYDAGEVCTEREGGYGRDPSGPKGLKRFRIHRFNFKPSSRPLNNSINFKPFYIDVI